MCLDQKLNQYHKELTGFSEDSVEAMDIADILRSSKDLLIDKSSFFILVKSTPVMSSTMSLTLSDSENIKYNKEEVF